MLSSAASAVLLERILRDSVQHLFIGALSLPIIYILVNEFIRKNAKIPHMNGPKGLPLLGNIWDIRVNAAEKYRQWANQYGDVYQIMLGNIPVVVVNSASAAKSVFGSNAQTLSSRPELYTFHKVSEAKREYRDTAFYLASFKRPITFSTVTLHILTCSIQRCCLTQLAQLLVLPHTATR